MFLKDVVIAYLSDFIKVLGGKDDDFFWLYWKRIWNIILEIIICIVLYSIVFV